MTQEEKQLLLKDLSARLPYGVICFAPDYEYGDIGKLWCIEPFEDLDPQITVQYPKGNTITKFCSEVKPYFRPLSSMTEEEVNQYYKIRTGEDRNKPLGELDAELFDFYNSRHLDYNELIKKELALEAPAGMYKID